MTDSPSLPSPSPKETPPPSSSPSPENQPTADPTPAPASASDRPRGRPKGSRTRKKTTRKSSKKKKIGVAESTGTPRPRPATKEPEPEPIKIAPDDIKKNLELIGDTLHFLGCDAFGIPDEYGPDLFKLTKDELDDIAPPLARIAGRHAAAARLAKASDEMLVTFVVGKAVVRNVVEARAAAALMDAEIAQTPTEVEGYGVTGKTADVPTVSSDGSGPGAPRGAGEGTQTSTGG